MTIITHDALHCHCRRCEAINHSPQLRAALAVGKYATLMVFGSFAAYHIVMWAMAGFVGFR